MALRQEVLSLYRRIFRLARKWESYTASPSDAGVESAYIKDEARKLFRKNKNVSNEQEILEFIKEGNTRIEMAIHYRIPYPRPINIPQNILPPTQRRMGKAQQRAIKQSKPIYLKSYEDT